MWRNQKRLAAVRRSGTLFSTTTVVPHRTDSGMGWFLNVGENEIETMQKGCMPYGPGEVLCRKLISVSWF